MSDKAAIMATFVNIRAVQSRKVTQLILEVPVEQTDQALQALGGYPQSANPKWVAVARLQVPARVNDAAAEYQAPPKQETPPPASVGAHRPFHTLPYPQQAALRCQDMSFRDFLRHRGFEDVKEQETAAAVVREICEVKSRADIRPGTKAEKLWLKLNTEYTFWESARAA